MAPILPRAFHRACNAFLSQSPGIAGDRRDRRDDAFSPPRVSAAVPGPRWRREAPPNLPATIWPSELYSTNILLPPKKSTPTGHPTSTRWHSSARARLPVAPQCQFCQDGVSKRSPLSPGFDLLTQSDGAASFAGCLRDRVQRAARVVASRRRLHGTEERLTPSWSCLWCGVDVISPSWPVVRLLLARRPNGRHPETVRPPKFLSGSLTKSSCASTANCV